MDHLPARIAALEQQLREANETLDAIRNGEVDAVVVGGPAGQIVYTLENADRPYRVLVEQMKEGAVTLSGDGMILYCNHSFAVLVDRRFEAIVGSSLFDHIADRPMVERMLAAPDAADAAEVSLRSSGTRAIPVNMSIVELQVEDGSPRMLCAIVTDLSHNYARAREVAEANARLASEMRQRSRAEENLAIALDAADMASWELSVDNEMVTSWGFAIGIEQFVDEDRADVMAAMDAARHSGALEFEKRILRPPENALRWIYVKGRVPPGLQGSERLAGIMLDVTERRLVDEQLRQAQKMEAVGQLTGGIAHDFNNLLMIIGGSLEIVARRAKLDERERKLIDAAQIGVARGAKLNQQLLAFARRQDMRVETVCINDLLPDFETLLDRALGEAIRVEIARGGDLWYCSTDPHQLETAILNLAINARDAMSDGGTLTFATANATVSEAFARRWDAKAGDYVVTVVTDTGSGMASDIVARVFEPFFTTKGVGRGTGLGLSQVYGFARQSSGFVTIDSRIGAGTTVSIYLPRAAAPKDVQPAVRTAPAIERYQGKVLLVEDDAEVRAATSAMIEELGYTVLPAAAGGEALDLLARDDAIDIVFSDVIMATGMTGIELAREIRKRRPDLPVLLTSGYTAQHRVPPATRENFPLLRKPYTIADLSHALRDVADGISERSEQRPAGFYPQPS